MKQLLRKINAMPLKWRITIWTSLSMCVLFLVYNLALFLALQSWSMGQEERTLYNLSDEIEGYFEDMPTFNLTESRSFLQKINQRNQLLRILDEKGNPVITLSDDLPEEWVPVRPATTRRMSNFWHYQDHLLVLRVPFEVGTFKGTIELARNLESFERLNKFILLALAVGLLVAVGVSGVVGITLARQFMKPISALTSTMGRIKENGLNERVVVVETKDELSSLSRMFNEMMDRLERSFQQQQQFIEDASHELRTPIAIIEGHLAMLERWGRHDPEVLNDSLRASLEETRRLKDLTQELLALSRAEADSSVGQAERIKPNLIINQLIDDFRVLHPDFTFVVDISDLNDAELAISSDHLKQLMLIFLDNAVHYSTDRKAVNVTAERVPDGRILVHITDYGIGIPSGELPRIFDRFYRVDKARSRRNGGSGLGLSIAKRLAELHQGTITIQSVEQKGTTVTLSLPEYQSTFHKGDS